MTIADKIQNRLKELGYQKQQFAKMMNVPPSTVTRWLKPGHNFQTFTLFEIERVLDLPIFNYDF